VPEKATVTSPVIAANAGITIHSQVGDSAEKPANTGWSTHGEASAPSVVAPSSGRRPAAIILTSSGASAATATHASDSAPTAARCPGERSWLRLVTRVAGSPKAVSAINRTKVTPATPTVSATSAPAVAEASCIGSRETRNCCISDSSVNHSDANPAVSGSPASVSEPTTRPVPAHGRRRHTPRNASSSVVPASASIAAVAVNSSDLPNACAIT
jgi:hypothetical protein